MPVEQKTTLNKILDHIWTVIKVILVLIYGCGYYVEKVFFAALRLIRRIVTLGWIGAICNVGEWVLSCGAAIGRFFARLGHFIAVSFVKDFSWWAPAIGLVGIITLAIFGHFFTVALEVSINDNSVGYVTDEDEYHRILNQVEDAIQNHLDQNAATTSTLVQTTSKQESDESMNITVAATDREDDQSTPTLSSLNLSGESYALTTTARYSLRIVRKSELATEEDFYSDVYSTVSELVGTNWGLYVDGDLKAACADGETINNILDEIKAPYHTGEENARVEFVQDVVVKKGMFASDTLKSEEDLRAMFETDSDNPAYYICQDGDYLSTVAAKFGMTTSQLQALNPDVKETAIYEGLKLNIAAPDIYLQVKLIKTETYTEAIDFDVVRENTNELYSGTTKVKTAGQKGTRQVTAEVTYVDGVRTGKSIVSSKVTKEPVDKVILVGTKTRSSSSGSGYVSGNYSAGDGIASGTFTNPLPGSYVSCGWYGYSGHKAVDLCLRGGTLNAAVYAADGGTVISSGWSGGYGNMIQIRHAGGYVTYYAHLNTRYVQVGDTVSKGQMIGRAGSTGNSTGPHLHFEIRKNGTAYNPANFIRF